jgi:hypothetical protein
VATILERVARLAEAESVPERAARLLGAAQALREQLGAPMPPVERPDYERFVTAIRTALGEGAFNHAWSEGKRVPLDEAIAEACAADDPMM